MADKARRYTQGTRAALAALSRGVCYFPGCGRQVIVFDELGEPYIDYQIAHIYDANVGNRYREAMTEDERRDFSNLILLCKPHHERIDKRHPDDYSPETLISWKKEHEVGGIAALSTPGTINQEDLDQQLREAAAMEFHDSVVNLGGTGGSAPGAGGGGGGVIGDGTGGPGGPGGNINLEGTPGKAPGAGGGGGGAIGPDAIGGEGGGGGEHVSGTFEVEEGDLIRFHVGEGGKEGMDGEDSYLELVGKDGVPRELLRAKAGRGGRSGVALQDERDGPSLKITSAFFCEAAQIKNGLLNVWGGGWDHLAFNALPADFTCVFVVLFEIVIPGPRETELTFELIDSEGITRAKELQPVTYDSHPSPHRGMFAQGFSDHEVTQPGNWRVIVTSGGQKLTEVELRVEVTPTEPSVPSDKTD